MFRSPAKAFSLLEVLFALALATIVLAIGFRFIPSAPSRAATMGLAEEVAEELRQARQQALSEHQPIAVVFPSANGTIPISKGLYILRGEDTPAIVKTRRFDAEYGDTAVFAGLWPTPDSSSPTVRAKDEDFDLATWLGAVSDPAIVFLPSGVVRSTLPSYNQRIGLLVSSRFVYAGNQANSAFRPQTIWVNPLGAVTIETGAPASVTQSESGDTVNAVLPPVLDTPGPDSPVITAVRTEPDFRADGLYSPADIWGGLRPGEYATLIVEATDINGGPLTTNWTGGGTFSSATEGRMEWDSDTALWRAVWTWTPPAEPPDPAGTIYSLSCQIQDPQGNTTVSTPLLSPKFVLSSGLVFAAQKAEGGSEYSVLLLTEEGHVTKKIPMAGQSPSPVSLNLDGSSYLVYEALSAGASPRDAVCFYKQNGDRQATLWEGRHASFSNPDQEIVYIAGSPRRIYWAPYSALGPTGSFVSNGNAVYPVKWGNNIVSQISYPLQTNVLAHYDISEPDPDATRFEIGYFPSSYNISPTISPNGQWIAFSAGGTLYMVANPPYTINGLGNKVATPPRVINSSGPIGKGLAWSPTGAELIFFRGTGTPPTVNISNQTLWRGQLDNPADPNSLRNVRPVSQINFGQARGLSWFQP
jgi:type II secretory pathway pseudopilin PulG